MKITWLGQAGLLFEKGDIKIVVDPYLSNSCFKMNPASDRRVPVDEKYLKIHPDVLVLTHDHQDHTDDETLEHYLTQKEKITVLASYNAWQHVRTYKGPHNYVSFNRYTEWTYEGIRFTAVKAEHSDTHAIGVIIEDEGKKYYVTGDTLYNNDIFNDVPEGVDAVFLPVNGAGNNMNFEDAARFSAKIKAKKTVPLHWGLFDGLDAGKDFVCENKVVPEFFKEIIL